MAGYSRLYCIGELGGAFGADGINPIRLQIWVGDADRQWLEAHYIDHSIKPLGAVKTIIPEGPDHPNALLDACLCFYPDHFRACPSLPVVAERLRGVKRLDFDQGKADIPLEWERLRHEAAALFRKLHIFKADLEPVDLGVEDAR